MDWKNVNYSEVLYVTLLVEFYTLFCIQTKDLINLKINKKSRDNALIELISISTILKFSALYLSVTSSSFYKVV